MNTHSVPLLSRAKSKGSSGVAGQTLDRNGTGQKFRPHPKSGVQMDRLTVWPVFHLLGKQAFWEFWQGKAFSTSVTAGVAISEESIQAMRPLQSIPLLVGIFRARFAEFRDVPPSGHGNAEGGECLSGRPMPMRRMIFAALFVFVSAACTGCIVPAYSGDPTRRTEELIHTSEGMRMILDEWERIWFLDQPDHMTPYRTHGGII